MYILCKWFSRGNCVVFVTLVQITLNVLSTMHFDINQTVNSNHQPITYNNPFNTDQ